MADTKITALTALTAADPANDVLPIVDVSDTTMAASGTTKKISVNNILGASGTATLASATITGDLTVKTNVLKVDTTNNVVGIGTATPNDWGAKFVSLRSTTGISYTGVWNDGVNSPRLEIGHTSNGSYLNASSASGGSYSRLRFQVAGADQYQIDTSGVFTWYDGAGGTRMTLNSTGLGVGLNPSSYVGRLVVGGTPAATSGAVVYVRDTFANGSNNSLGSIMFASSPGSDFYVGKKVSSAVGWFSIGNANSGAEYFQIDASGNVGVGVTPSAWSGNKAIQLPSYGSYAFGGSGGSIPANAYYDGAWKYIANGYATKYDTQQGIGAHLWYTAPSGTAGTAITFTQAMTLAASGNLLIGTTTDVSTVRMQVWSSSADNTAQFRNSNASTPYGPSVKYTAATPNNTGSEFLYCEDSTALRASIRSNGGIANYQANDVSLSDSRLKTDIKPLASYWNKIKSLELVTFKYKDQTHSDDNIGLIAQQVESVAPELVDVDGFGETPADGVPIKTIYTTDLYHAAIKALQEAMARIEALEAKLA